MYPLEAGINFTGISALILTIAGLVVMAVGVSITANARKGGTRPAANTGGGVIIGIIIITIGATFAVASGIATGLIKFLAG